MPTYYPTANGNVTFHDLGAQQVVTRDGLTIESPAAEALCEYGHLLEGDPTEKTLPAAVAPALDADAAAVLDAPVVDPPVVAADAGEPVVHNPVTDDAPVVEAAVVEDTVDPKPPASEEAQPQGPAAKTPPKGK